MIDLYSAVSPNVMKIIIALEEMELKYNIKPVDVFGRGSEQFGDDFIKISPTSKVPAIVDHDGPGGEPYSVFESGAILLYLADKTGKFLSGDARERFDTVQWLIAQVAGQGPMFGQLVHFKNFAPAGSDYGLVRYMTQAKRLYRVLERRLSESPFLGGESYSIADIAMFPWTTNRFVGIGGILASTKDQYSSLVRWFDAISARPAVARAMALHEALRPRITSVFDADAKDLDRVFGRGDHAQP